jgi:hypothetical protein
MIAQRLLIGTVALALAGGLTACASDAEPVAETATPTPQPSVVETVEPEPEPVVFAMPADCTTILPESRLENFASQNLALLGGPGGVFGDEYFFDPTPEQLAGGISCVYAEEGVDFSSLLISVAPVSTANRAEIINDLTAQGLNESTTDEGAVAYSQQGDEGVAPAIYNVITQSSWISVISTFGGPVFYEEAITIAGEVTGEVYQ